MNAVIVWVVTSSLSTVHAFKFVYRSTLIMSSMSLCSSLLSALLGSALNMLALLGGDLAVVLDVDVVVGRQGVNLVFGEGGTGYVSFHAM